MGLGSPQLPEIAWPSPNGRLVIVSHALEVPAKARARSVPSQSAKWNRVVPEVPPL
jgi:hypothetical protein